MAVQRFLISTLRILTLSHSSNWRKRNQESLYARHLPLRNLLTTLIFLREWTISLMKKMKKLRRKRQRRYHLTMRTKIWLQIRTDLTFCLTMTKKTSRVSLYHLRRNHNFITLRTKLCSQSSTSFWISFLIRLTTCHSIKSAPLTLLSYWLRLFLQDLLRTALTSNAKWFTLEMWPSLIEPQSTKWSYRACSFPKISMA